MQAAPLDLRARLRERGGERVADREVAQVPDVQRLGRVRVPELHREALSLREVRERRLGAAAGLQRRAGRLDPAVGQAQAHSVAPACHGCHPRLALDPLELAPATPDRARQSDERGVSFRS